MKNIANSWCVQIDITNYCGHGCSYCSRYNKHLRNDQRSNMSLEMVESALDSLKDWPTIIGVIGGEPILHPQFTEICKLIQSKFPRSKMGLWTSGGKKWNEYKSIVDETFGFVAFNEHNEFQLDTCKHQPMTIAINEAVEDQNIREKLIDDCWVQREWCATINVHGAYFCEVAAAQDLLLNDGKNAWPVDSNWWRKTPPDFTEQRNALCGNCGMAIPMERDLIRNRIEKISPRLLKYFQDRNLIKIEVGKDVEIFNHKFTKEELIYNSKTWTPGNYRGDVYDDSVCPEGKGLTSELI